MLSDVFTHNVCNEIVIDKIVYLKNNFSDFSNNSNNFMLSSVLFIFFILFFIRS